VLLLGGLCVPLVVAAVPVLGGVALTLVAVVAFVVAGYGVGHLRQPVRHGVFAALGAYALVLPLVLFSPAGRDPVQIGLTVTTAVAVGAVTGFVAGRRHTGGPGKRPGGSRCAQGRRESLGGANEVTHPSGK
jgi:hypothetical protein